MRIAFITSEYITDQNNQGGLGNYLHRFARLLVESGHEIEIFVLSKVEPRLLDQDGIRVQRVAPISSRLIKAPFKFISLALFRGYHGYNLLTAWVMANAFKKRHQEAPFDIVQSADIHAISLFIPKLEGCVKVVRCSYAIDLYYAMDGLPAWSSKWYTKLEILALRRAEVVYAPSRLVADHYRDKFGLDMSVVRPPLKMEVNESDIEAIGLPPRFLLHFGQLLPRKGTAWLARALKLAFQQEPELSVVLVGKLGDSKLLKAFDALGPFRSRVLILYPLPKPQLYSIIQKADAVILPSLVDNLPNSVIESLMFHLPVIGTQGASIDELVEQDISGELVEADNDEALANAIVKVWRGQSKVKKGFEWKSKTASEMVPEVAVQRFLQVCKKG